MPLHTCVLQGWLVGAGARPGRFQVPRTIPLSRPRLTARTRATAPPTTHQPRRHFRAPPGAPLRAQFELDLEAPNCNCCDCGPDACVPWAAGMPKAAAHLDEPSPAESICIAAVGAAPKIDAPGC